MAIRRVRAGGGRAAPSGGPRREDQPKRPAASRANAAKRRAGRGGAKPAKAKAGRQGPGPGGRARSTRGPGAGLAARPHRTTSMERARGTPVGPPKRRSGSRVAQAPRGTATAGAARRATAQAGFRPRGEAGSAREGGLGGSAPRPAAPGVTAEVTRGPRSAGGRMQPREEREAEGTLGGQVEGEPPEDTAGRAPREGTARTEDVTMTPEGTEARPLGGPRFTGEPFTGERLKGPRIERARPRRRE